MYRIYTPSGTIETDSLEEALTYQKKGCHAEKVPYMQTSDEYYNRDRLFERKSKLTDVDLKEIYQALDEFEPGAVFDKPKRFSRIRAFFKRIS